MWRKEERKIVNEMKVPESSGNRNDCQQTNTLWAIYKCLEK